MNARTSENYLAILCSSSASKSAEICWAEIYWGRLFFRAESSLIQSSSRQTSGESASLPQYLGCNKVFDTRHISSSEDRVTSIKHCTPRISSKMATIDEFALKNIGL
jgi:hypothetical protein